MLCITVICDDLTRLFFVAGDNKHFAFLFYRFCPLFTESYTIMAKRVNSRLIKIN